MYDNTSHDCEQSYTAHNVHDTQTIACNFIHSILSPTILVLLSAPVGAGKSVFVKAALNCLGADTSQFISPSYTWVCEYESLNKHNNQKNYIYHIDLYRLSSINLEKPETSAEVLNSLDIFDKIQTGIVFIEWANRIDTTYFTPPYYHVYIEHAHTKNSSDIPNDVSLTQRNIKIITHKKTKK